MHTLIFATGSEHKLSEIRSILPYHEIKGLMDVGITEDIEETGLTLEENALIKAKYLFEKTQCISLSEDTGLEVDALDGAPGVHTARFAGDHKNPDDNMAKLLELLSETESRSAQFRTVIALIDHDQTLYFEGIVKGSIAKVKSGNKGFGYDPVFIPDGYDRTFADLDVSVKNNISHRAKAIMKLVDYLQKR
jgi:XTP/dITP diphosphohydrolase